MNPLLLPPFAQTIPTPKQFVGFPETLAAAEHINVLNASCPGESSGSFLNITAPDDGCNSPHLQPGPPPPPFKLSIGLKANYTGAQMDFAVSQLQANPHINLVTLTIGANDVLLVLAQCGTDTTCVQNGLNQALQAYAGNLATILTQIRVHYKGTLIMTKYYSPSADLTPIAAAVNTVMTQVAAQLATQKGFNPVLFADGFTAFQIASAPYNGDPCQAGLLIQLPPPNPPCDIHPSPRGRDLLAAVEGITQLLGH